MGWQDRDWAKWTEDERRGFFGGGAASGLSAVPGAFLGIVASLVAIVMLGQPFHHSRPTLRPIYGTAEIDGPMGQRTTCTKMEIDAGKWTCDVFSILLAGQRALPAAPLPPGSLCRIAVVNQASRRWTCATTS